ncbi:DUF2945 domain-containing protein [Pelagicoccus sp. SDUM812002]|uniref:DUF2945 domain-containing protein n=1 Tax=Pelagicoccus sp. SDUM812002 TaxID=3041266 RepID=UPI0031F30E50
MIRKGTEVKWTWRDGTAKGKVRERFTSAVSRVFDGAKVKRKATRSKPAYLIQQEDGSRVLKSKSELSRSD